VFCVFVCYIIAVPYAVCSSATPQALVLDVDVFFWWDFGRGCGILGVMWDLGAWARGVKVGRAGSGAK
jgi:hypothetical protein